MSTQSEAIEATRTLVRSGFYELNEIVSIVCEDLFAPGEVEVSWISEVAREQLAQRQAEAATWEDVTDCNRLHRAFEELDSMGVIALHNVGNEDSDGISEVSQTYNDYGGESSRFIGYCFYHWQDVTGAMAGHGLFVKFGEIAGREKEGVNIGRVIADVILAAGLEVKWSGSLSDAIFLPSIVWKHRGFVA